MLLSAIRSGSLLLFLLLSISGCNPFSSSKPAPDPTGAPPASPASDDTQDRSKPKNSDTPQPQVSPTPPVPSSTPSVTPAPPVFGSDASLSSLVLSSGTLSPAFAAGTLAYTANVGIGMNTIMVTSTLMDSTATIMLRVNGGRWASVTSGSSSNALTIAVGINSVDVKVTAQDGTTTATYTVIVTRRNLPGIYITGNLYDSAGVEIPGFWQDGVWARLPSLDITKDAEAGKPVVSGYDLYVPGVCINSADAAVPGYWKNGTWVALQIPVVGQSAATSTLWVSDSRVTDVYVSGYSENNLPGYVPGYWLNGIWHTLPDLANHAQPARALTILKLGSALYIAGENGTAANPSFAKAVSWKNAAATQLEDLGAGYESSVSALVSVASDVYAFGYAADAWGRQPGYWLNEGSFVSYSYPTPVAPATGFGDLDVNSAVSSGSDLYVGGDVVDNNPDVGGYHLVAGYWLNGTWQTLPSLAAGADASVRDMLVSGSDVYAVGISRSLPALSNGDEQGIQVPGFWHNGVWTSLSQLDTGYWSEAVGVASVGP